MRYRGGGVGHLYMREVEQWLRETGWGCDIPDAEEKQEDVLAKEGSDLGVGDDPEELGSEPDEGDEPYLELGEPENGEEDLDPESDEGDDENEIIEDEDTIEGGYGYGIL